MPDTCTPGAAVATTCAGWRRRTVCRVPRVDEVLELVGLDAVGGHRVRTYSLGMRQRLGLAGVLLGDPHTVVLDEPANGLDPEGIRWIRDVLVHLASQGRTVLVSSHLLSEMALMANDLVVIGQGRLIEQCTVAEFVERHADRWVRVKSPSIEALIAAAARREAPTSTRSTPPPLELRGINTAEVGELAARNGIVLHELSPQTGSLEDAFLQATAGAQEYSSQALDPVIMINTLRSEWIKLRTVRMNCVLFIIAVAFPVVVCVLVGLAAATSTDLTVSDVAGLVTGTSVVTALLLGVVGAVSITAEFAYGTIRPTFAATPRRMRVLVRQGHRHRRVRSASPRPWWWCSATSWRRSIATSRGASVSLTGDDRGAGRADRRRRLRRHRQPARLRLRHGHPQHARRRRHPHPVAAGRREHHPPDPLGRRRRQPAEVPAVQLGHRAAATPTRRHPRTSAGSPAASTSRRSPPSSPRSARSITTRRDA